MVLTSQVRKKRAQAEKLFKEIMTKIPQIWLNA